MCCYEMGAFQAMPGYFFFLSETQIYYFYLCFSQFAMLLYFISKMSLGGEKSGVCTKQDPPTFPVVEQLLLIQAYVVFTSLSCFLLSMRTSKLTFRHTHPTCAAAGVAICTQGKAHVQCAKQTCTRVHANSIWLEGFFDASVFFFFPPFSGREEKEVQKSYFPSFFFFFFNFHQAFSGTVQKIQLGTKGFYVFVNLDFLIFVFNFLSKKNGKCETRL